MPAIQDHNYLRLCAELASCLSISQSAARRRVEHEAARSGAKDLMARLQVAANLLEQAKKEATSGEALDQLLEAQPIDQHFMLED